MNNTFLEWQRDPKGYEIIPAAPADPKGTIAGGAPKPMTIVGRGGDPVTYRPPLESLVFLFAKVSTPAELLRFVNRYGLLTRYKSEIVPDALRWAQQIRGLVSALNGSGEVRLDQPVELAELRAVLSTDGSLQFGPATLLDGLWLQAGLTAKGGVRRLQQCAFPACNKLFQVGPNSRPRRRGDAKYCSPEHQELHKSLRRSVA